MNINELEKAALKLSPKERAALSLKLLESIDSEKDVNIDMVWQNEVEERYKTLVTGKAIGKNAGQVINEAKSKYK